MQDQLLNIREVKERVSVDGQDQNLQPDQAEEIPPPLPAPFPRVVGG